MKLSEVTLNEANTSLQCHSRMFQAGMIADEFPDMSLG